LDAERQRQLESYRRKFEEALVRIEDKDDVEDMENAKREIDDEFDEEGGERQDTVTQANTDKEGAQDNLEAGEGQEDNKNSKD
jgi:hypothetical protein